MSKMVWHEGTGTVISLDEIEIVDVPEHVEDAEIWLKNGGHKPRKRTFQAEPVVTIMVEAWDEEDAVEQINAQLEQFAFSWSEYEVEE